MDNLNIIKTIIISGVSIDFKLALNDTTLRLENEKINIRVADFIWTNVAKQFNPITGQQNYKKDYVVDLEYEDDWGSGTLLNCFFMIGDDSIEIVFDHFKYHDQSETFTSKDFITFINKLCQKLSDKNIELSKQRSKVLAPEDRPRYFHQRTYKFHHSQILNQMLEEHPNALLYKPMSWFNKKFHL